MLDGAIGVFCAVGSVEPQSETVWRQSEKFRVPKLAFVNKMDRPGADFQAVLEAMRVKLGTRPLAVQVPLGAAQDFYGVVDLLSLERLQFDEASQGEEYERLPLTPAEREHVAPWREALLDMLTELDDELLERYLAGEELPLELLRRALREGTIQSRFVPVFAGSALRNIGVQPLIDAICDYLPSPLETVPATGTDPATHEKRQLAPDPKAPLAALVFKITMETGRKLALVRLYSGSIEAGQTVFNITRDREERAARLFRLHAGHKERLDNAMAGDIVAVAGLKDARTGDTLCDKSSPVLLESIAAYKPVISIALEPKNTADGERLSEILDKCQQEDPTLFFTQDVETGQRILSGMGELHLEVVLERVAREYGLNPRVGNPQVVYQETISRTATAEGEFQRELGDVPHYGNVTLSVEPLERDKGRDIVFEVDSASWPASWLDAIAQGVGDSLQSGVLKGCPVQDVRVRVKELRRKDGESTPAGYHMAAVNALKKALSAAQPVLLEPIMWVEISLPAEFVGDAIGLLGSKGAKVENIFDHAGQKTIQALAPMRSLFGFSTALRSATQGRAGLMLKFARFDVHE